VRDFVRSTVLILVGGLSCSVLGQSAARIPAVAVSAPNRVLNLKVDDPCNIDFANTQMSGEKESQSVRLKKGKYKNESASKYESVRLEHNYCLDDKDHKHRALVVTNWSDCGVGCTSTGVLQLFEVRATQPVITQQFVFDSHGEGTGATFDDGSLTLTITTRSDDGSPSCCAQNLDVVTYGWQGTEFRQTSYRRVPAPAPLLVRLQYGKHEFPDRSSSTCLTVFRDGRFQMGQVWDWPRSQTPRFFEDSLTDESLKALQAILEAPGLTKLRRIEVPVGVPIRRGETLSVTIPRGDARQDLIFVAVELPAGPIPRSLPESARPLVQWLEATRNNINQRKLKPLKNAKSAGGCWLDKH